MTAPRRRLPAERMTAPRRRLPAERMTYRPNAQLRAELGWQPTIPAPRGQLRAKLQAASSS